MCTPPVYKGGINVARYKYLYVLHIDITEFDLGCSQVYAMTEFNKVKREFGETHDVWLERKKVKDHRRSDD